MSIVIWVCSPKVSAKRIHLGSVARSICGERAVVMPFGGSYGGKRYEESGADPWDLTDQQKEFIVKDRVRHVLIMGLENTETAVRCRSAARSS